MGGINAQVYVRYTLLTSENIDCAEADTKQRQTVAARRLKQVGEKLGYSAGMCFLIYVMSMVVHVLPFDWCN